VPGPDSFRPHGPGLLGRIEVKPDHIAHLLYKKRIRGQFESLLQMRFESEGPPNAMNGILGQAALFCHAAGAPVRRMLRLAFESQGNDFLHHGVADLARLARTRRIRQTRQTQPPKARAPFADRRQTYLQAAGHFRVRLSFSAFHNDAAAQGHGLTGFAPACQFLEFGSFLFR